MVGFSEFKSVHSYRQLGAFDMIESPLCITREEDWSKCRSPSRAKRRLRRGYPQRVVVREKPTSYVINGIFYIHPDLMKSLRERIASDMNKARERSVYERIFPVSDEALRKEPYQGRSTIEAIRLAAKEGG